MQVDYGVQRDVVEMTIGITATLVCKRGWLPDTERRTTCRLLLLYFFGRDSSPHCAEGKDQHTHAGTDVDVVRWMCIKNGQGLLWVVT